MKTFIFAFMLIGILGLTPFCHAQAQDAGTSIKQVKKETQNLLQTNGSYTSDKRDEAVQTAQQGLVKLDKRINGLETKIDNNWDSMNDAARKKAHENQFSQCVGPLENRIL